MFENLVYLHTLYIYIYTYTYDAIYTLVLCCFCVAQGLHFFIVREPLSRILSLANVVAAMSKPYHPISPPFLSIMYYLTLNADPIARLLRLIKTLLRFPSNFFFSRCVPFRQLRRSCAINGETRLRSVHTKREIMRSVHCHGIYNFLII